MRFMVIVKSGGDCASAAAPGSQFIADMQKFNKELNDAGVLLALEGLHPAAQGMRIRAFMAALSTPRKRRFISVLWRRTRNSNSCAPGKPPIFCPEPRFCR